MWRFSLRSLLLVMFVFAIVAGWAGNLYRRQQLREHDEQALAVLGAVFDEDLSSVRHFKGLGARGSEQFITIVARQPDLRSITLDGTELSDRQAAKLLGLPLEALAIHECSIGGTLRAKASPTLTWLSFFRTRLDDHSLAALGSLPNVKTLVLYRTRVSDRSIDHLASLSSIKTINIRRCKISPDGAARLRQLRPDISVKYAPLN